MERLNPQRPLTAATPQKRSIGILIQEPQSTSLLIGYLLSDFKGLGNPCKITTVECVGLGPEIGTVFVSVTINDVVNTLQLNNIIYALKMDSNLLSLTTLYSQEYEISMHPHMV